MTAPRKDSVLTKARILNTAEKLFSEKGYDGARVDDIAKRAGVNKALIYYYFKSKDEILDALFTSAMRDVIALIEQTYADFQLDDEELERIFSVLVDLISRKKNIIKVMLMESLKETGSGKSYLFKIADYFIRGEVETIHDLFKENESVLPETIDRNQMLVTEFFTGIMPLINYVVFEKEYCRHFDMSEKQLRELFFQAFKMTHLAYHTHFLKK
jgi:AcrR family transcriptional regulator